ncbi:unnamed protein product [Blepharisma stoltei]|uniref:Cyclin N-terminal domain-containing protein n=1 Tax=Blepharisma stoltei TaxID=1481888 RepID=A0AAU9KBN3_9CILI|nr:unnamed protein product [Blepharisma stoltei]
MGNQNFQEKEMSSILNYNNTIKTPESLSHFDSMVHDDVDHTNSIGVINQDMNDLLRLICRILLSYILEGQKSTISEQSMIFDEIHYLKIKWYTQQLSNHMDILPFFGFFQKEIKPEFPVPTVLQIFDFIKPTFENLFVQHECVVMMLIYVERLITEGGVQLSSTNWRPIVYTGLLLSSKIWEDICVLNIDFANLYPYYTIRSTNLLEMNFASALGWRLFISPEQYSKYYFHLKEMISPISRSHLKKRSSLKLIP